MNIGPTWTDTRTEQVKKLAADGLSASQIGDELGVTRNAVIGKLARLGVPLRGSWVLPMTPRVKPQPQPKRVTVNPPHPEPHRRPATRRTIIRPARAGGCDEVETVTVPEAVDLPADTSEFKCSILELDETRCHWPISDPGKPDFGYCGAAVAGGRVYCTRHHRLAHKVNGYRGSWG